LKVVGETLKQPGLVVFALVAESYGHGALAEIAVVGALAIGVVYAIKSKSTTNRS
jgi:hypothetical protein